MHTVSDDDVRKRLIEKPSHILSRRRKGRCYILR